MEGTQMPINMAAVASPLKYNISENISERKAEMNNNLSVIVNFVNIILVIQKILLKDVKKTEFKNVAQR